MPFMVVLNAAGAKIADSNRMPGGKNMGCPASAAEIEQFDKVLQETAPRITAAQRARIADKFRILNEKKN